jgi:hypothetical protein
MSSNFYDNQGLYVAVNQAKSSSSALVTDRANVGFGQLCQ